MPLHKRPSSLTPFPAAANIHNPNDSTEPIPRHCLEPGRSPGLALLSVAGSGATRITWYLDADHLLDVARLRHADITRAQQPSQPRPTLPKTTDQAAQLLASPCSHFYLLRSHEEALDLAHDFFARADSIESALTNIVAEFYEASLPRD